MTTQLALDVPGEGGWYTIDVDHRARTTGTRTFGRFKSRAKALEAADGHARRLCIEDPIIRVERMPEAMQARMDANHTDRKATA